MKSSGIDWDAEEEKQLLVERLQAPATQALIDAGYELKDPATGQDQDQDVAFLDQAQRISSTITCGGGLPINRARDSICGLM